MLPESAGRNERYMILRAIERVDPRAVYGRPWTALGLMDQLELLAFSDLRQHEESRMLRL